MTVLKITVPKVVLTGYSMKMIKAKFESKSDIYSLVKIITCTRSSGI